MTASRLLHTRWFGLLLPLACVALLAAARRGALDGIAGLAAVA